MICLAVERPCLTQGWPFFFASNVVARHCFHLVSALFCYCRQFQLDTDLLAEGPDHFKAC